jgi:hypothetical protein
MLMEILLNYRKVCFAGRHFNPFFLSVFYLSATCLVGNKNLNRKIMKLKIGQISVVKIMKFLEISKFGK